VPTPGCQYRHENCFCHRLLPYACTLCLVVPFKFLSVKLSDIRHRDSLAATSQVVIGGPRHSGGESIRCTRGLRCRCAVASVIHIVDGMLAVVAGINFAVLRRSGCLVQGRTEEGQQDVSGAHGAEGHECGGTADLEVALRSLRLHT
jgi:hypothetical protein